MDSSNVPTSWKDFNDALAAGEDIDILLGLEDDSIDSKTNTKGKFSINCYCLFNFS